MSLPRSPGQETFPVVLVSFLNEKISSFFSYLNILFANGRYNTVDGMRVNYQRLRGMLFKFRQYSGEQVL